MARDHGGGVDAAVEKWGGERAEWIDLSTGINPVPYPTGSISPLAFNTLPDTSAREALIEAARSFWKVPEGIDILPTNGASQAIARFPDFLPTSTVYIPSPTYNEHRGAFDATGYEGGFDDPSAGTHIYVHPNNPTGAYWSVDDITGRALTVVDESFCDVSPDQSFVPFNPDQNLIVLKSFGKFWGLAGLRLGFVIGRSELITPLRARLEPWAVNGPAIEVATRALRDDDWADNTRVRLTNDAERLDEIVCGNGAKVVGGTSLFRLYEVDDAAKWRDRLARSHIWSRIFPYSENWLRLGLPAPDQWQRIEAAL